MTGAHRTLGQPSVAPGDSPDAIVAALHEHVAVERELLTSMCAQLKRHDHALYGNGRPGLLETVAKLRGGLIVVGIAAPIFATVAAMALAKGLGL